jgi:hypothetical protein
VRYRLRFHLQEVDLGGDEVVLGRGSMCHITIDDPMLSRRHVRIDLSGSNPSLEDLDSRNGTQLNGRPVQGAARLQDGDRIRIGTQELVFLVPDRSKTDFRTTSGLRFCAGCAVPYPSGSPHCPHCGAAVTADAEAESDRGMSPAGWTFHLLAQVVGRAIEQGRLADAERMLSRGVAEVDEQLDASAPTDAPRVAALAECAARLGCALRTGRWLEIGARLYAAAEASPSHEVLALVDGLPPDARLEAAVSLLRDVESEARRAI